MPASTNDLARVVDAFNDRRSAVIDRTVATVTGWFSRIDNFYAPTPQAVAFSYIADVLGAGQVAVARLTDAYLSRTSSLVRGETVSPAGVADSMRGSLRAGVESHEQVYERGAAEYRRQIALGRSKTDALELALNRVTEMARADLGLAHRDQSYRFSQVRTIARYRRVVTGEGTCGLCIAASDRLYYKADLLPIHDGCNCTIMETTVRDDPGSTINKEFLDELYEAAGSTKAADLRRVRVETFDHGEMGPTLKIVGQNARTASDVPKTVAPKTDTFWNRASVEKQIRITESLKPSDWRDIQLNRLHSWLATN